MEKKRGKWWGKGWVWRVNGGKVEKMGEEVEKWGGKEGVRVRGRMGRGAQPRLSGLSGPCAPCAHIQPQQSCYPAPASVHVGNPFALHSPCAQTTAVGGLNSPPAGLVPPVYSGSLQAEYSVSARSVQDFVTEGFASGYDVDALNPSLTDLQLQGNVWEELQEDCLASDPQVANSLLDPNVTPSCLQATASSVCQTMCENQNGESAEHLEHHSSLKGPHPPAHSGGEILAGYVTTCTTSISLM
ncbi:unnamed protein product [Tetraodon nigroviridis]|uniref:(spotted green pufferfish) hypothetical protein n=1 Tax=Tetraodon nigroviridis TaxID=99883 RepID=Q4RCC2_TETNG|nr:unnamed protein product [Tetraodon nigroviridis]